MTKIAVIGAGSAGTTAAYRLRKELGQNVEITVYERESEVGGRVHQIEFAGTRVEVGATVLHSTGRWIKELLEYTGLKPGSGGVQFDGKDEIYGFWNGLKFTLTTRASFIYLGLGILRHYGLKSAIRTTFATRKLAAAWTKIYAKQRAGELFESTGELLDALNIRNYQIRSLRDALEAEGVNPSFVSEVLEGITRNMYTQDGTLNSFAGEVGLAGAGLAGGSLYAIAEGNQELFATALAKLGVTLKLNTTVSEIAASPDAVRVTASDGEATYDAVLVATPLELADIALTVSGQPYVGAERAFQNVHVTLVAGDINRAYFGLPPTSRLPSMVFVANTPDAKFSSLGITGFSPVHDKRIYKFFTVDAPLDDAVINEVFETIAEVTRFEWRGAYPVLKAGVEGDPFRLAERLYYANGFESAASTVELDAVAAQNATGLLLRDLRDVFASQDAQDEQIAQDAQGSQPLPDAPAVSEA